MKNRFGILTAAAVLTFAISVHAQGRGGMGGPPSPDFSGAMVKYFGDNPNFKADVEFQAKDMQGSDMSMPGKITFSEGKTRFEMNMDEMRSGNKKSAGAAQMKEMGMDRMIMITRPDKEVSDIIYPGMKAYVEMPIKKSAEAGKPEDFKIEMTELGKETVDGHPCVKNKAVATDKEGNKHEATLWNATDLKKFPVKIEQNEQGQHVVMLFKNVEFSKPDAAQFEPPADLKKYTSMQEMFQEIMMQKFGGGNGRGKFGAPPPPPGQP